MWRYFSKWEKMSQNGMDFGDLGHLGCQVCLVFWVLGTLMMLIGMIFWIQAEPERIDGWRLEPQANGGKSEPGINGLKDCTDRKIV